MAANDDGEGEDTTLTPDRQQPQPQAEPERENQAGMTAQQQAARERTADVQSDASSFSELQLPEHLVTALAAAGYTRPSPVQKAAIPLGRLGADLIVQAKSGTGKTVVFAVVCIERVKAGVAGPQVGEHEGCGVQCTGVRSQACAAQRATHPARSGCNACSRAPGPSPFPCRRSSWLLTGSWRRRRRR